MKFGAVMVLAGAALLASGCDKREVKRATVSLSGESVIVDGDRAACLKQVWVEYAGTKTTDQLPSPDDSKPWSAEAAEGGCIKFPVMVGAKPAGATDKVPGRVYPGERYRVIAANDTARYEAGFENGRNGIFYVPDASGTWTDIRKAKQ